MGRIGEDRKRKKRVKGKLIIYINFYSNLFGINLTYLLSVRIT